MTKAIINTAEEDLLKNVQFDPVFDEDGNLVDIIRLEVPNDRSRGIRAMEELAATRKEGDEIVYQDGWSGYLKRILNSPAPGAAHTIKPSRKWDSKTGAFIHEATLILPYEVVWTLFDRIFFGNYSISVEELVYESEDVRASQVQTAENLLGRTFYARAKVNITVHLPNGNQRVYSGIGVAYDTLRESMTGNVYAVNSARRTAEKGAVSDAKREALANIGRVFTRAYENGNEAIRAIEDKILEKVRSPLASNTRPKLITPSGSNNTTKQGRPAQSAPPAAKKNVSANKEPAKTSTAKANPPKPEDKTTKPEEKSAKQENNSAKPEDKTTSEKPTKNEAPKETAQQETVDTPAVNDTQADAETAKTTASPDTESTSESNDAGYMIVSDAGKTTVPSPEDAFDFAADALSTLDSEGARKKFLDTNRAVLLQAESDSNDLLFADLEAMVPDLEPVNAQSAPSEDEVAPTDAHVITPKNTTGQAILNAYEKAFKEKPTEINQILEANVSFARQLTSRQKLELVKMANKIMGN